MAAINLLGPNPCNVPCLGSDDERRWRDSAHRRHVTTLAGHGVNVLAFRLDLGLLVVRQVHQPLKNGFHLSFLHLVEGDLLQGAMPYLEIAG